MGAAVVPKCHLQSLERALIMTTGVEDRSITLASPHAAETVPKYQQHQAETWPGLYPKAVCLVLVLETVPGAGPMTGKQMLCH